VRNDHHGRHRVRGELHDRMPVILEPKQFQASLTGGAGLELLKPAANDLLQ
jgi:putative SOS response-associated peptidase YedK